MIVLNTIMADSFDYLATILEQAVEDGEDFNVAVQKLLTEVITKHGAVVFNGDGYSENWQIEAAERGLPNVKTTLGAIPELIKPAAVEVFEKYGVFNERELHSRYQVRLEQYALTIAVEAKLTLEIGTTVILPAAIRYQTELVKNVGTHESRRCGAQHDCAGSGFGSPSRSFRSVDNAEDGAVRSLGGVGARRGQACPGGAAAGDASSAHPPRDTGKRCSR
jgi:glutamine synthetase type III